MWEKLFLFKEETDPMVVPPLKLCEFPFSEGSYRPFSQVALYAEENKGVFISFKAFYEKPFLNDDDIFGGSALTVSMGNENGSFVFTFSPDGRSLLKSKKASKETPVVLRTAEGGDQQGEYFISGAFFPFSFLNETLGIGSLKEGDKINLNCFYSVLENDKGFPTHFASVFNNSEDAVDEKSALYSETNRGVVTAIEF